eukprot:CAMPEP_0119270430 /NCGR_PEP_ID=MMETSP1329-20130426/7438_1 /TAXON_ID=114041 /ORGANISM="Genus nov. species nov., Strain RCC1024" /LENGTH=73 /DNA_ID=CAMNT_0007270451 /DNA_START=60 /DNA_END=277 /DNA_ORIENTATION=-
MAMVLDAARAVECGQTDELACAEASAVARDAEDASDGDTDDYAVLLFYAYREWRDQKQFRDAQEALCVELGLA